MSTSSRSHFNDQLLMLPLHPQAGATGVTGFHSSFSLVSLNGSASRNLLKCGSNYDPIQESSTKRDSSRDTWPILMLE